MSKKTYWKFDCDAWLRDTQHLSPATRGLWLEWLIHLHNHPGLNGVLSGDRAKLCRIGRCLDAELDAAIKELRDENTAEISERNGIYTIVNRRINRKNRAQKGAFSGPLKTQKTGFKTDLSPPHTPPVNINNSKRSYRGRIKKTPALYTLEQVKDACILSGIPDNNAQSYYDQYNSQDWCKANGQPITNLRSHMAKRWKKDKQCWDFDSELKETKFTGKGNRNDRNSRRDISQPPASAFGSEVEV